MTFIADLHIHSKFSRATARDLDLEHVYISAQLKGITVVGTGDFTHPEWFAEIKKKLVPVEDGLFMLKPDIAKHLDKQIPSGCRNQVRFMLVTEISNIYKKNEKTRKNHNLIFSPTLESAEKFNRRLDRIGNIHSDGRPILGMDARNLLEIALETDPRQFLIPAHIWTPWFSLFGSKSGFDSLEECFEDLTPHIFAVETGLSSDPAMNWRVSMLDGLTLVSNSDAHSPGKLGREANLFETDLSYDAMRKAMETGNPKHFLGTLEFYPEEGKYHLDGHRKCGLRLSPTETRQCNGICPICGKPLTLGVLYRVEELADRPEGHRPEHTHPFSSIIPLTDILAEVLRSGPNTKKVTQSVEKLLTSLGSEFDILRNVPPEELDKCGIPLLGEAINRMRNERVVFEPGYDGEFGVVKLFTDEERKTLPGQKHLFSVAEAPENPVEPKTVSKNETDNLPETLKTPVSKIQEPRSTYTALNAAQSRAINCRSQAILIVAGPGTGKTYTLTRRIAYLIEHGDVKPENVLAVTFTNKAAHEMRERLSKLINLEPEGIFAGTFHGFCLKMLRDFAGRKIGSIISEEDRLNVVKDAVFMVTENEDGSFLKPSAV